MYDAEYYEIQELQKKLAKNGISKEQLDLDNYAGLTRRELDGIVNIAIANKNKKVSTVE